MEWLNYHHLLYFHAVVREGGVSRAAERLRLSQSTVSAQIRLLEEALGERLFLRQNRTLLLTDVGRVVFRYADEMFAIGGEMLETLRGRPPGRPQQLAVGIANAVPKLIAYGLLVPAVARPDPFYVVCREGNAEALIMELANHTLDVVLADRPAPVHVRVKVFNHLLGESDVSFFAPRAAAPRLRRGFPQSLTGVGMTMPTASATLRRDLEAWLQKEGVRPQVVGEFEDSALMKVFGESTGVVFPAPSVTSAEVCRLYGVSEIGRTASVRERYYAISAERRITHPGVLAITGAAHDDLFAERPAPTARKRSGSRPVRSTPEAASGRRRR